MAQKSNTKYHWGIQITNSLSAYANKVSSSYNRVNKLALTNVFSATVQAKNPGWPTDLSPRPYSWSKEVTTGGIGAQVSWDYTYKSAYTPMWTFTWSQGIMEASVAYGSPLMPDYSVIYNNALEKFYSKVRGESANLVVDAIEMPKTLKLLIQYSKDLMSLRKKLLGSLADPRAVARLRREFTRFKNSKKFKKQVRIYRYDIKRVFKNTDDFAANEWLKFTLGLRPTLSTLDTIAKLMPRAADVMHTVTGSDMQMCRKVELWQSGDKKYVAEHDTLISVRITGSYSVGDAQKAFLHTIVPALPVSTVWELIPLSFVADYAVNIGQYLNLLDAAHARGLVFRGGYARRFNSAVTTTSGGTYGIPSSKTGYTYGVTGYRRALSYSRTLISSFPRPCRPSVRLNLNGEKIANIGALLDQFARRICRSSTS